MLQFGGSKATKLVLRRIAINSGLHLSCQPRQHLCCFAFLIFPILRVYYCVLSAFEKSIIYFQLKSPSFHITIFECREIEYLSCQMCLASQTVVPLRHLYSFFLQASMDDLEASLREARRSAESLKRLSRSMRDDLHDELSRSLHRGSLNSSWLL